jgi:hypothetical protein
MGQRRGLIRIVLTAHIFERRWYGNTHRDRETKAFEIAKSLKSNFEEEKDTSPWA